MTQNLVRANGIITKAVAEFSSYAAQFDFDDERINLKLVHMHKVADISQQIARSIDCADEEVNLAYILGLYHDIGRFAQLRDYGTFSDVASVDHAKLSADVIEQEQMLDWLDPQERERLLTAIRNHNKLAVDQSVTNDNTLIMCKIIRDADKIDIFRVFDESSIESITGHSSNDIESSFVSEQVTAHINAHESVPNSARTTSLDKLVSTLGFIFDINYPKSMQLIIEQGYFKHLITKFKYSSPVVTDTVICLLLDTEEYANRFLLD